MVGLAVVTVTMAVVEVCGGPWEDVVVDIVAGGPAGAGGPGGAGVELDDSAGWEDGVVELLGIMLDIDGADEDPEEPEDGEEDEPDILDVELDPGGVINAGYGGR